MINERIGNDVWSDTDGILWDDADDFKYGEGSGADYDDFSETWEPSDFDEDGEDMSDYLHYQDIDDDRY